MSGPSVTIPFDVERRRLVTPFDLVEVQELRELPLAVVGERDLFVGKERAGQQPFGGVVGLRDVLALPCTRFLFLRRTVLHAVACRSEFPQGAGELIADLADGHDGPEHSLAGPE